LPLRHRTKTWDVAVLQMYCKAGVGWRRLASATPVFDLADSAAASVAADPTVRAELEMQ